MYRHILAPIDGSATSTRALEAAYSAMAEQYRWQIREPIRIEPRSRGHVQEPASAL